MSESRINFFYTLFRIKESRINFFESLFRISESKITILFHWFETWIMIQLILWFFANLWILMDSLNLAAENGVWRNRWQKSIEHSLQVGLFHRKRLDNFWFYFIHHFAKACVLRISGVTNYSTGSCDAKNAEKLKRKKAFYFCTKTAYCFTTLIGCVSVNNIGCVDNWKSTRE